MHLISGDVAHMECLCLVSDWQPPQKLTVKIRPKETIEQKPPQAWILPFKPLPLILFSAGCLIQLFIKSTMSIWDCMAKLDAEWLENLDCIKCHESKNTGIKRSIQVQCQFDRSLVWTKVMSLLKGSPKTVTRGKNCGIEAKTIQIRVSDVKDLNLRKICNHR